MTNMEKNIIDERSLSRAVIDGSFLLFKSHAFSDYVEAPTQEIPAKANAETDVRVDKIKYVDPHPFRTPRAPRTLP